MDMRNIVTKCVEMVFNSGFGRNEFELNMIGSGGNWLCTPNE